MTGTSHFAALTLRLMSLATVIVCFQHMRQALNDIQHTQRRSDVVLPQSSRSSDAAKEKVSVPLSEHTNRRDENLQLSFFNSTMAPRFVNATMLPRAMLPRRRRKRGRRKRKVVSESTTDDDQPPPPPLKVPLPIFVPSLPKSGTTSVHKYFLCGGQKSAHHVFKKHGKVQNKIGRCVKRNVAKGKPPFEGCGDYDVWTDTGFVNAPYQQGVTRQNEEGDVSCYYPLIEALDEIYEEYPNATMLFVVRNEDAWLNSIQKYHDGFIFDVWKQCNTNGFPGKNATLEDFRAFYRWHQQFIRKFARRHPSMTYIEAPLEPDSTAQLLQEKTGVSADCWGHYYKTKKRSPKQQLKDS